MKKVEQLQISTPPTSESFSEKSSPTFHDFLPSHSITTADRSAKTYYGNSKLKAVIRRRITEPAISSPPKMGISNNTERQKQGEKSSAVRRSTLQTPRMRGLVEGLMKAKSSTKKDGSVILSRLFSLSSDKMDEGNRKDMVYEYDSDEGIGTFEEHKVV